MRGVVRNKDILEVESSKSAENALIKYYEIKVSLATLEALYLLLLTDYRPLGTQVQVRYFQNLGRDNNEFLEGSEIDIPTLKLLKPLIFT